MIWAAVDVLDGRCVQLRGGRPGTARFSQDPLAAARRWQREGADGLHLIDLNAALGTGENRAVLLSILQEVDLPVQVGGGIRDDRQVEGWLKAGAERVIVGTRGIWDPAWLRHMAGRYPGRIVLAVDARAGEITVAGWRRSSGRSLLEFVRSVDELALAALLFTDVDVEGTLEGLQEGVVAELCAAVRTPVLVAGGLRDRRDVRRAYALGAAGVVLGTALYAGTLRLSEVKTHDTSG